MRVQTVSDPGIEILQTGVCLFIFRRGKCLKSQSRQGMESEFRLALCPTHLEPFPASSHFLRTLGPNALSCPNLVPGQSCHRVSAEGKLAEEINASLLAFVSSRGSFKI